MIFQNQQYMFLVVLAPLVGIWLIYFFRLRDAQRKRFADDKLFRLIAPVQRHWVPAARVLILTVAILLLTIAVARPKGGDITVQTTAEGIDIFLLLDLSKSMIVEDVGVSEGAARSRMFFQKEIAKAIVKNHPSDRIGLIGFTGEAFLICPLTLDHSTVLTFIDGIEIPRSPLNPGTAFGEAILLAISRFDGEYGRGVVLMTDGENNKGTNPISAAREARRNNIALFPIGIGTDSGARLFERDEYNRVIPRTFRGDPVFVGIDKNTLDEIADITNGKAFYVEQFQDAKRVFVEFDKTSKTLFQSGSMSRKQELAHWFILGAVLLLILDFIIDKFRLLPRVVNDQVWIQNNNSSSKSSTRSASVSGTRKH